MPRSIQFPLLAAVVLAALALLLPQSSLVGVAEDKPADLKGYTETIPDTQVKFEMLPIPGGTYVMGSPDSEKGHAADEGPQHPVTIKPFWMGKLEVTWDEYDCYWKADDRSDEKGADAITRPTPPYADETFGLGREGYPVICITHHAAMEYCRWLSKRTGKTYRLPTEAEWEYACRAGTKTAYFFGDDPAAIGDYAWYKENSEEITHQVGQKKPNPWGLHDIVGNVCEWCLDTYKADAYSQYPKDKPTLQPVILPTANRFSNVSRGGSWNDAPDRCRSATRIPSNKTWIRLDPQRPQSIWWLTSAEFVGFRIVRPLEEQDNLKGIKSKVTKQSD